MDLIDKVIQLVVKVISGFGCFVVFDVVTVSCCGLASEFHTCLAFLGLVCMLTEESLLSQSCTLYVDPEVESFVFRTLSLVGLMVAL